MVERRILRMAASGLVLKCRTQFDYLAWMLVDLACQSQVSTSVRSFQSLLMKTCYGSWFVESFLEFHWPRSLTCHRSREPDESGPRDT